MSRRGGRSGGDHRIGALRSVDLPAHSTNTAHATITAYQPVVAPTAPVVAAAPAAPAAGAAGVTTTAAAAPKKKKVAGAHNLTAAAREHWAHFPLETLSTDEIAVSHSYLDVPIEVRRGVDSTHIPRSKPAAPAAVASSAAAAAAAASQPSAGDDDAEAEDAVSADAAPAPAPAAAPASAHATETDDAAAAASEMDILAVDLALDPKAHAEACFKRVSAALSTGSICGSASVESALSSLAFVSLQQRRQIVLRHVHSVLAALQPQTALNGDEPVTAAAAAAEQKSGHSSSHATPHDPRLVAASKVSPNPMLRMTVLTLFPLINSLAKTDPELKCQVLGVITQILSTLPRLALANEPVDAIDSFRTLLQSMIGAGSGSTPATRRDALSALLGLSVQHGTLSHILSVVHSLLSAPAGDASAAGAVASPLAVTPFLHHLARYRYRLQIPILDHTSYVGIWQHAGATLTDRPDRALRSGHAAAAGTFKDAMYYRPIESAKEYIIGSIATDGVFLFLHNKTGLLRVGTGSGGTIRGYVYAHNPLFNKDRTEEKKSGSALLYMAGRLFFASQAPLKPKPKPVAAAAVAAAAAPAAALSSAPPASADSSAAPPALAPAASASVKPQAAAVEEPTFLLEIDPRTLLETNKLKIDLPAHVKVPPPYVAITTDQHFMYALSFADATPHNNGITTGAGPTATASTSRHASNRPSAVDVWSISSDDPNRVRLVRSFQLRDAPERTDRYSSRQSGARQPAYLPWKFFCTGTHIVRINSPDKVGLQDQFAAWRADTFITATGEHVARYSSPEYSFTKHPTSDPRGHAMCYDTINNKIYSYSPKMYAIRTWNNHGPTPSPDFLDQLQTAPASASFMLAPRPIRTFASTYVYDHSDPTACEPFAVGGGDDDEYDASPQALAAAIAASGYDAKSPLATENGTASSAACVMYHLGRLCDGLEPVKFTDAATAKVTMCVDVSAAAFKSLTEIIEFCAKALTAGSRPVSDPAFRMHYCVLYSALRVCRLNVLYAERNPASIAAAAAGGSIDALKARLVALTSIVLKDANSYANELRRLSLVVLMSGLSVFYPTANDLSSLLLAGAWRSHPIVLDALTAYDKTCLLLSKSRLRAEFDSKSADSGVLSALIRLCASEAAAATASANAGTSASAATADQKHEKDHKEIPLANAYTAAAKNARLSGTVPLLSPALRLLSALQNSLLARVDCDTIRPFVISYAERLLSAASQALKEAASKGRAADSSLRNSFVALLVPTLITCLARKEVCGYPQLMSSLIRGPASPLSAVLRAFDTYNLTLALRPVETAFLDQSAPAAATATATAAASAPPTLTSPASASANPMSSAGTASTTPAIGSGEFAVDVKVVETPHPYDISMTKTLEFDAPVLVVLTFDSRSSALRSDTLSVVDRDGRAVAKGYSTGFPTKAISVRTDKLVFGWTVASADSAQKSASARERYGFRCTVQVFRSTGSGAVASASGAVAGSSIGLPWSLDLQNSIALLCGRATQAMMFTPAAAASEESKVVRAVLNSDLFAAGTRTVDAKSSRDSFYSDLVEGRAGSAAHKLFEFMRSKGGASRPIMLPEVDKIMVRVEAAIAAVLLHHTGLVDSAIAFAAGSAASAMNADSNEYRELKARVWDRIHTLDRTILGLGRLQKQWHELLVGYATTSIAELAILDVKQLAAVCEFKNITPDKSDPKVTRTRVLHRIARELKDQYAIDFVVPKSGAVISVPAAPPSPALPPANSPDSKLDVKSPAAAAPKVVPPQSTADSYREIAKSIIARAQFLLSLSSPFELVPATPPPSSSLALTKTPSASRLPAAVSGAASLASPSLTRTQSNSSSGRRDANSMPPPGDELSLVRVNSLRKNNSTTSHVTASGATATPPPAPVEVAAPELVRAESDLKSSFQKFQSFATAARRTKPSEAYVCAAARTAAIVGPHFSLRVDSSTSNRLKLISSFLTSTYDPALFSRAITVRQSHAQNRIDGLTTLNELLSACGSFSSAQNSILLGLGASIRAHWAGGSSDADGAFDAAAQSVKGTGVHFLSGVQGCGFELTTQLRAVYGQSMRRLVRILTADHHSSTKALAIDALTVVYQPADIALLNESGLFPALRSLFSAEREALRVSARTLFTLLATLILWWKDKRTPIPDDVVSAKLINFQNSVFGLLIEEVRREIDALARAAKAAQQTRERQQREKTERRLKEKETRDKEIAAKEVRDKQEKEKAAAAAAAAKPDSKSADLMSKSDSKTEKDNKSESAIAAPIPAPASDAAASPAATGVATATANASGARAKEDATAPPLPDEAVYQLLVVLFRLRASPVMKRYLLGPTAASAPVAAAASGGSGAAAFALIDVLMRLLGDATGTLRCQRLGLRLIRFILTEPDLIEPFDEAVSVASSGVAVDKPSALVLALMERAGELISGAEASHPALVFAHTPVPPPKPVASGTAAAADAEGVDLAKKEKEEKYSVRVYNTDPDQSDQQFLSLLMHHNKTIVSSAMKNELRQQMATSGKAYVTLLVGPKTECSRIASEVAKKGFCCSVIPQPPEDGLVKNQSLIHINPSYWMSGFGSLSLCSEIVNLLRVLSHHLRWTSLVETHVTRWLSDLPSVVPRMRAELNARQLSKLAGQPAAALAVLGGFNELLRLGGRVTCLMNDDSETLSYGTITRFERGRKEARVMFDGEQTPSTVDCTRLTAISESSVGAIDWVCKPAVIDSMLNFINAKPIKAFDPAYSRNAAPSTPPQAATTPASKSANATPSTSASSTKPAATSASTAKPASGDAKKAEHSASAEASESSRLRHQLVLSTLQSLLAILQTPTLAQRLSRRTDLIQTFVRLANQCSASSSQHQIEDHSIKCLERFLDLQRPATVIKPVIPSSDPNAPSSAEADGEVAKAPSDNSGALLPHFRHAASISKKVSAQFGFDFVKFVIFESTDRRTVNFTRTGGAPAFESGRRVPARELHIRRHEDDLVRAGQKDEFVLLGNAPIPLQLTEYYFEVQLLSVSAVSIGLSPKPLNDMSVVDLNQQDLIPAFPTWGDDTFRLSTRDGKFVRILANGKEVSEQFCDPFGSRNDVVGCGWNLRDGSLYFTKNGRLIRTAVQLNASASSAKKLFPAVGVFTAGTSFRVNFGAEPFAYTLPNRDDTESDAERAKRLERAAQAEIDAKREEEQQRNRRLLEKLQRDEQRRALAKRLIETAGAAIDFNERKAMICLEQGRDDLERTADWLLGRPNLTEVNRRYAQEMEAEKAAAAKAKELGVANSSNQASKATDAAKKLTPAEERKRTEEEAKKQAAAAFAKLQSETKAAAAATGGGGGGNRNSNAAAAPRRQTSGGSGGAAEAHDDGGDDLQRALAMSASTAEHNSQNDLQRAMAASRRDNEAKEKKRREAEAAEKKAAAALAAAAQSAAAASAEKDSESEMAAAIAAALAASMAPQPPTPKPDEKAAAPPAAAAPAIDNKATSPSAAAATAPVVSPTSDAKKSDDAKKADETAKKPEDSKAPAPAADAKATTPLADATAAATTPSTVPTAAAATTTPIAATETKPAVATADASAASATATAAAPAAAPAAESSSIDDELAMALAMSVGAAVPADASAAVVTPTIAPDAKKDELKVPPTPVLGPTPAPPTIVTTPTATPTPTSAATTAAAATPTTATPVATPAPVAAATPATIEFNYDTFYSSGVVLSESFPRPEDESAVDDSSLDPATLDWIAEINQMMIQQEIEPADRSTILSGLRAGGESRDNALVMLPEHFPPLPPAPVKSEAWERGGGNSQIPIEFNEIRPGLRVQVARSIDEVKRASAAAAGAGASSLPSSSAPQSVWVGRMRAVRDRIGVVTEILSNQSQLVKVSFENTELNALDEWWIPVAALRKVAEKHDSDAFIGLETVADVRTYANLRQNESLAFLYARRAILSLISHAPQCLDAVKAAAALVSSGEIKITPTPTAAPAAGSKDAKTPVPATPTPIASSSPLIPSTPVKAPSAGAAPESKSVTGYVEVLQLGAAECLQALDVGDSALPPALETLFESALRHDPAVCERVLSDTIAIMKRESVIIDTELTSSAKDLVEDGESKLIRLESASALVVSFSVDSRLPTKDDSISFFSDLAGTKPLHTYRGGGSAKTALPALRPFVVHSNKFYVSVNTDKKNSRGVICKFDVCPIPTKFNLFCWMVAHSIRGLNQSNSNAANANSGPGVTRRPTSDVKSPSAKSTTPTAIATAAGAATLPAIDWADTLTRLLSSLGSFLSHPKLPTLLRIAVFQLMNRILLALASSKLDPTSATPTLTKVSSDSVPIAVSVPASSPPVTPSANPFAVPSGGAASALLSGVKSIVSNLFGSPAATPTPASTASTPPSITRTASVVPAAPPLPITPPVLTPAIEIGAAALYREMCNLQKSELQDRPAYAGPIAPSVYLQNLVELLSSYRRVFGESHFMSAVVQRAAAIKQTAPSRKAPAVHASKKAAMAYERNGAELDDFSGVLSELVAGDGRGMYVNDLRTIIERAEATAIAMAAALASSAATPVTGAATATPATPNAKPSSTTSSSSNSAPAAASAANNNSGTKPSAAATQSAVAAQIARNIRDANPIHMKQLTDLGFDAEASAAALIEFRSFSRALDYLSTPRPAVQKKEDPNQGKDKDYFLNKKKELDAAKAAAAAAGTGATAGAADAKKTDAAATPIASTTPAASTPAATPPGAATASGKTDDKPATATATTAATASTTTATSGSASTSTGASAAPGTVVPPARTEFWFDMYCHAATFVDVIYSGRAWPLPSAFVHSAFRFDKAAVAGDIETAEREHRSGAWPLSLDLELCQLAAKAEESLGVKLINTSHDLRGLVRDKANAIRASLHQLSKVDTDRTVRRLRLFQYFNLCLQFALPLIDLTRAKGPTTSDTSSFAYRLSFCRALVFPSVRNDYVTKILDRTCREDTGSGSGSGAGSGSSSSSGAGGKPKIVIDRLVASLAREKEGEHNAVSGQYSVFGQAFKQLQYCPAVKLLPPRPTGGNPHTAFDVKFKGEHVVGEGGPYRQFFTDVCKELLVDSPDDSAAASAAAATSSGGATSGGLFVQCPNKAVGVGENRDKFVPRPCASNSQFLQQFEMLGRLMGIALRTGVLLTLDLPSFVWKPLCSLPITRADLEGIDSSFVHGVLDRIAPDAGAATAVADEKAFTDHFGVDGLTWSTTLSDKTRVDLKPGGRFIPVTFKERHEYAIAAERARFNESSEQLKAMRRGLIEIVPESLIALCPWHDLERRVCGRPFIDIAMLRRHTEYSGVDPAAPHIGFFWTVLEEMSQDDRRRFIKFAYAQERLPSSDDEFTVGGIKIRLLIKGESLKPNQKADDRFPRSDTCFFNLSLPHYGSIAVMRQKLQTVIHLATALDADEDAAGARAADPSAGAGGFGGDLAIAAAAEQQLAAAAAGDDDAEALDDPDADADL